MVFDPPLQDHAEPGTHEPAQNYPISELPGRLFWVSHGFFRVVILGKSQFGLELKLLAFEKGLSEAGTRVFVGLLILADLA